MTGKDTPDKVEDSDPHPWFEEEDESEERSRLETYEQQA